MSVRKVIISAGREIGGLDSFAKALKSGFEELSIESEILSIQDMIKRKSDLRNEEILKILSTKSLFLAPLCKNTISVAHGFPRRDVQGTLKWLTILKAYEIARRYSKLVSVSNYVALHLQACFGIKSDKVIYNPLLPVFLSKTCLQNIHSRKYITYIGRFHSVKNIDLFIKPLKKFLSRNPNFKVLFIGHGDQKKTLMNLIKNDERFLIREPMSPQEIKNILQQTQIFFSGCETEALGITYLEALSQGCNVVMPMQGGGSEIAPELICKRIYTFSSRKEENEIVKAFNMAKQLNRVTFDTRPFSPKTIAEQYLVLSEKGSK